jgi:hypothetical protein
LTPKLTNNITIAVKTAKASLSLTATVLPVSAYQTSKSLSKFYPEQFYKNVRRRSDLSDRPDIRCHFQGAYDGYA